MRLRITLALTLLFAVTSSLPAALTWTFNYAPSPGIGFHDPTVSGSTTLGQIRRDALDLAATNFSTAFSAYTANVTIEARGDASGGTLAAAASNAGAAQVIGFGNNTVIRNKILNPGVGGGDINGPLDDGFVIVNWGINWELDINGTVTPGFGGEFDWYSTMYHEFAHALGFASGIGTDGAGQNASDPFGTVGNNQGEWNKFDEFLTDSGGASVFGDPAGAADLKESTYEGLLTGGPSPSGGLFFNGANAKAANGGNPVGLYSPTAFSGGSSGSHTDDENAALAGTMMLANTPEGPSARVFSAIERGMFMDIGYTQVTNITPVPEPSAFLFMGLLGILFTLKRRFGKSA